MTTKNNAKLTCVLVHGWAMNSAVWEQCLPLLPEWLDIIRVDLPGHGTMTEVDVFSINDYVHALSAVVSRPALWVGWSLGGLAVLKLAEQYPERVAGLFMVANNPCFVKKQDWPVGVEQNIFHQFAESLEQDVDNTIKRFLALQVKGSPSAMKTVRSLQQAIKKRGQPSIKALKLGLDILADTDFRTTLKAIEHPLQWYLGERDTLVPVAIADELRKMNPKIDVLIEKAAAHAPFVSHPESFARKLIDFAERLR